MRTALCFLGMWVLGSIALIAGETQEEASSSDATTLIRFDLIHYYQSRATKRPSSVTSTCYNLLDVREPTLPVSCAINPDNPDKLTEDFVVSAISAAAATWNKAIKKNAFDKEYAVDGTIKAPVVDGTNSIVFSDIFLDTSIISETSLYVDSSTTPWTIIEFDILLNSKLAWGDATQDPNVMDVQAVVTHELGHALGLGDVWDPACSQDTMYGFSSFGSTQDRKLSKPDIRALRLIYQRQH